MCREAVEKNGRLENLLLSIQAFYQALLSTKAAHLTQHWHVQNYLSEVLAVLLDVVKKELKPKYVDRTSKHHFDSNILSYLVLYNDIPKLCKN